MRKPTVCIDYDGVLHPYTDGWQGSTPADEPPTIPTINAIYRFHQAGYRIVVCSARANHAEGTRRHQRVAAPVPARGLHRPRHAREADGSVLRR